VGPETLTETLSDTMALMSTNPHTAAAQCVHTRGARSSGWHRQRRSARIIAVRASVRELLLVNLVEVRDGETMSTNWKSNDLVFGQVKTIVAHHPIKVDLRAGNGRTLYEEGAAATWSPKNEADDTRSHYLFHTHGSDSDVVNRHTRPCQSY
jgi:hypothetical protein